MPVLAVIWPTTTGSRQPLSTRPGPPVYPPHPAGFCCISARHLESRNSEPKKIAARRASAAHTRPRRRTMRAKLGWLHLALNGNPSQPSLLERTRRKSARLKARRGQEAAANCRDFGTSRCGPSLTLHLSTSVRKGRSWATPRHS